MLSVLAELDDMYRYQVAMNDAANETDQEFLRFLRADDERNQQWHGAVQEAERLQRELDASLQNMADLETKLFHARRLLEMENKARREAEHEREQIEKKLFAVADIVHNTENRKDICDKLEFLKSYPKKRKSVNVRVDEKYANDINSTGSFLSDLSVTHSEEDFLDVRSSKNWSKPRQSKTKNSEVLVGNRPAKCSRTSTDRRRSNTKTTNYFTEIGKNDVICATTKVSIPAHGPIIAESIIEAVPDSDTGSTETPTQKPTTTTTESTTATATDGKSTDQENRNFGYSKLSPKKFQSPIKSANYFTTPTAPPPPPSDSTYKSAPPKVSELKRSVLRCHIFSSKTFMKYDNCTHCQKKIRFGSVALKCKNCRVIVHQDCRDLLTVSCVPLNTGNTPTFKGLMGYLSDYAPSVAPMIPALIIHCVSEIEARGLNEIGIYRVSGSEREIKTLKEKFLRNKSVPSISNTDVHVLCGCVKDFLRSLREPLIPVKQWKDFSNAAQTYDEDDRITELYKAVDNLPQANRDTLAFLMLHFQRVAECTAIKMPIENIAKIFGPTIVGYSSAEPSCHAIYTETVIQYQVMSNLMNIPGSYWIKFTTPEDIDSENFKIRHDIAPETPKRADMPIYATPLKSTAKKDRKFYPTPPYPYKKN